MVQQDKDRYNVAWGCEIISVLYIMQREEKNISGWKSLPFFMRQPILYPSHFIMRRVF
jgi:hypothetical protein